MKIGFVFDDSLDRSDGVQQYIKTLGTWLMANGHEVRYLVGQTIDSGSYQPYVHSLSKNIGVRFNKNRLSIPLPASKRHIKRVLMEEKFEVLHVQAPFSPMLAEKVILAADKEVGIVSTFHIVGDGLKENAGLRLLKLLQRKSLKRINRNLAVSPAAVQTAKNYYYSSTDVCPNVVDLTRFDAPLEKQRRASKQLKLVFLGRLVERKGAHHLIEAVNLLKKSELIDRLILQIAGDGPDRAYLEGKVKEYGLSEVVEFLGFIDEEIKPRFLAEADVAVFPATSGESFGIVLIEAMAVGTLTLGGNNEGYAGVLDGPKEMLVNPRNHREFASRLERLLTDSKLKMKLYKWQGQRVKDFDVETVGPKLLEYYRAAIVHATSLSKKG